jgi:hypothetical protein
MTSNVLDKKPEARKPADRGLAIGETDAHVFNCPSCARALAEGTSLCPGCGAHLILGVLVRRAGVILALGVVIGMLVGGAVMASVITLSLRESAAAAAAAAAAEAAAAAPPAEAASAAPSAAAVPSSEVALDADIPAGSITALSGTAVVNGRITVDTATLADTLARKGATTIEIARALRSLAADAALGRDLTARMSPWVAARAVTSRLDAFYSAIADTARAGLRASLADAGSYRGAAGSMLTVLAGLGSIDAESRTLAATIDLELPPVAGPDPSATSGPEVPPGH